MGAALPLRLAQQCRWIAGRVFCVFQFQPLNPDDALVDVFCKKAAEETNIEDQMDLLSERAADTPVEEEFSLRLLRHYATSVRHQQYHDTDVVTVRVESAVS